MILGSVSIDMYSRDTYTVTTKKDVGETISLSQNNTKANWNKPKSSTDAASLSKKWSKLMVTIVQVVTAAFESMQNGISKRWENMLIREMVKIF